MLAFYRFVRAADDVADHPTAPPNQKLDLLEQMRASLMGENNAVPEGVALRDALQAGGLSSVHALDLLEAFRRDVTKLRYRDWDDLLDYCRYSAMPVGRFVLDVHGESRDSWPANDALCAALQIINHLQDCAKDYRELDRVYIPEDAMAAAGIDVTALAAPAASPALKSVIAGLAAKNAELLRPIAPVRRPDPRPQACPGSRSDPNPRRRSQRHPLPPRDPLSQKVHHSKLDVAALFVKRLPAFAFARLRHRP